MNMLFIFVCFAACSSAPLKYNYGNENVGLNYMPDIGLWYKIVKHADGRELFYADDDLLGWARKNSDGEYDSCTLRVSGGISGDYFLFYGHILGWVSRDKTSKLVDLAKVVDFGHTSLVPRSYKPEDAKESDDKFRVETITKECFKQRAEWLSYFYATTIRDLRAGRLIGQMSESEHKQLKKMEIKVHKHVDKDLVETIERCIFQ
ncbi:hypothetical protein VCUG_00994 [Vavraia culicis subsp. floridensis]|uniref:Uncharacterized protein n=1 Tax=Vavraia culicis (isolate floridensis) TaxID=948595 RepID=L2GVU0_VAVCU|nr:uncharacterized protein VCUG_00994 [Vavraia culicis subsp. floridensis]ELA47462.1 hypothetical protein VCUG_00994 [Vavraia culicis subsp. floridensis]